MPTIKELVDKVGSTNAADLAAIAYGPALLPALEAMIADTAVAMPRRMAATRVANEIRSRALAAPPAEPAPEVPAGGEARAFFGGGGQLESDGFHAHHDPLAFVDGLYGAGATNVVVASRTLVVTLPANAEARARLFAIYNAEVDRFDQEFGGEEPQGHEMTSADAAAIGRPDAVGEWVVDDLHAHDRGQASLTFWWD